MPRIAILRHDAPFLHWDLLLETGDVARAWRLLRNPAIEEPIAAEELPDHRLLYLDYEGPVSNDRGTVAAIFRGEYEPETGSRVAGDDFSMSCTFVIRIHRQTANWTGGLFRSDSGRLFWIFSGSQPFALPTSG